MRITLNLSPSASVRDRFALVWAIPATVLGGALLVFLCRASLREFGEYRGFEEQLADVQARTSDLRNQEAALRQKLEGPAYKDLLRQAKFVNQLIDRRVLSLSALSARLAGLLPEEARLTGLSLTPPKQPGSDYVLRMAISAKGEDAIDTFLGDLEDAPDFKDVSILNQGFQEENTQGQDVKLLCTARFLPAAEMAVEEESVESGIRSPATEENSQETGDRRQESEVRSQKSAAGGQKAAGESQKVEKASAQKQTTNR